MDRINTHVIYQFALARVGCAGWCLLDNCRQDIASLSLNIGKTVVITVLGKAGALGVVMYVMPIVYIIDMFATYCMAIL